MPTPPLVPAALAAAAASLSTAAWAVRGRSSSILAPSIWHGDRSSRRIALTFDDGPSPATLEIAALLEKHNARATFFQCGANAARHPGVTREIAQRGHEIANHTWSHPRLDFTTTAFMRDQIGRTQDLLSELSGHAPRLFRAPYGVRWWGLGRVQKEWNLLGVMWTCLARDWKLPAPAVASRILSAAHGGAIVCLHDGRELAANPDVRATVSAIRDCLPRLIEQGFSLVTVSDMLRPPPASGNSL